MRTMGTAVIEAFLGLASREFAKIIRADTARMADMCH